MRNSLLRKFVPVSGGFERLLTLRLNSTTGPVTLISVYAQTLFYENLASIIRNIPSKEQILLGDFNARVGEDQDSWSSCHSQFGVGKINKTDSDYWSCAPFMTCALQIPCAPSLNTRFPGDTLLKALAPTVSDPGQTCCYQECSHALLPQCGLRYRPLLGVL